MQSKYFLVIFIWNPIETIVTSSFNQVKNIEDAIKSGLKQGNQEI